MANFAIYLQHLYEGWGAVAVGWVGKGRVGWEGRSGLAVAPAVTAVI